GAGAPLRQRFAPAALAYAGQVSGRCGQAASIEAAAAHAFGIVPQLGGALSAGSRLQQLQLPLLAAIADSCHADRTGIGKVELQPDRCQAGCKLLRPSLPCPRL
ncbi:hypothetical protein ABPG75_009176, partial [Micractinium tetrahymenae]